MAISIRCDCGKTILVPDGLVGQFATCFHCGASNRVTRPSAPASSPAPPPKVAAVAPPPPPPPPPPPRRPDPFGGPPAGRPAAPSGGETARERPARVEPPPAAQQRYREAMDALRDRPRDPDLLADVGRAAEEIGQRNEAFLYYQKAVAIDPSRADLIERLDATAFTPEQRRIVDGHASRPISFSSALDGMFGYPFKGAGVGILVFGTAILFLVQLMMKLSVFPIATLFAATILLAYMSSFYISVLNSSALGQDEVPHWPDFTDIASLIVDWLKFTIAHLVAYFPIIAAAAGFFIWMMLSLWSADEEGFVMAAPPDVPPVFMPPPPAPPDDMQDPEETPEPSAEGTPAPVSRPRPPPPAGPNPLTALAAAVGVLALLGLGLFFLVLGTLYLPMAITANAIFGFPFACVNPVFILRSIWATKKDYAMCVFAYLVPGAIASALQWASGINWMLWFLSVIPACFVAMYATVVQMRLLGVFYRFNQVKLGWLTEKGV